MGDTWGDVSEASERRQPQTSASDVRLLRQHVTSAYDVSETSASARRQLDVSRMSAGCQPDVSRMSAGCQPDVSRMSAGCQPDVSRMSAGCQPDVSRMSAGCQPDVSQMSAGCQPDVGDRRRELQYILAEMSTLSATSYNFKKHSHNRFECIFICEIISVICYCVNF